MGQGSSGNVLQARLVVHDQIGIILGVLVHLGLQHTVYITIAALALGAAHDQHIEVVFLDEGVVKLHFGIVCLGHSRGNGTGLFGVSHLFPDLTQGDVGFHAQNLVEVTVGIRVHNQDGALFLLAQILNDHAAGSGLADAAFSGNGNGMGICHKLCSFDGLVGKPPG